MTVVGIIPARGGSQRLPRKNLQPLGGRPLIAHACAAALDSAALDAVYVNTDDAEIAAAAADAGVTCPALRPAALARPESPTRSAIAWQLDWLAARGETFDAVMILQPTSPLRTAEDIAAAWALFEEEAPCSVVGVSPVSPESWLGRLGRDGRMERFVGEEMVYRVNGAIYIHNVDDYLNERPARKNVAYVMPSERGIDIDTHVDLVAARSLFDAQARIMQ